MVKRVEEQERVKTEAVLRPEQLAFLLWQTIFQEHHNDPVETTQYLLGDGKSESSLALVPSGVGAYLEAYRAGGAAEVESISDRIGLMFKQEVGIACSLEETEEVVVLDTTRLKQRVGQLGEGVDTLVKMIEEDGGADLPLSPKSRPKPERRAKKEVVGIGSKDIAEYLGVEQKQITIQKIRDGRRPGVLMVGAVSCVPVLAIPSVELGPDKIELERMAAEDDKWVRAHERESASAGTARNGWREELRGGVAMFANVLMGSFVLPLNLLIDPLLIKIDKSKLGKLPPASEPMIDAINELSRIMVRTAIELLSFSEVATAFDAAVANRPVAVKKEWDKKRTERVKFGLSTLAAIATTMRRAYGVLMEYQWAYINEITIDARKDGSIPEDHGLLLAQEARALGEMIEAMFTGLTGSGRGVKVAGDDSSLIRRMQQGRL